MASDNPDNSGNVIIPFPKGKATGGESNHPPIQQAVETRRDPTQKSCMRCLRISINEHTRTVTCRDCGKVHDPFAWLSQVSKWETSIFENTHALNRDIKYKRESLEKLQQAETNARNRIKRVQAKLKELEAKLADTTSAVKAREQIALFLEQCE